MKGKADRVQTLHCGRKDVRRRICLEYNVGKCTRMRCKFDHNCDSCLGLHLQVAYLWRPGSSVEASSPSGPLDPHQNQYSETCAWGWSSSPLPSENETSDLEGSLLSLAHTPIRLSSLVLLLLAYPSWTAALYLWEGFNHEFRIPYVGPRVEMDANNIKSTRDLPHVVQQKLNKEIAAGRIVGPFNHPPLPHFQVPSLGAVLKKMGGEFHLIQHLSYLKGALVNNAIPAEYCLVRYA